MRISSLLVPIVFMASIFSMARGQDKTDSASINKKRLNAVMIGTATAYGLSLIALNEMWYKEQGKSGFHFFNDNGQWNQVDKAGHAYSAYQLSRIGNQLFLWTNMDEKKSAIWGAVMSQGIMIPIEVLDGFSVEYGFSWGDIAANLLGSSLFLGQALAWKEQKIKLKYSYHQTDYATMRPEVLGKSFNERLLKDYNGHTYWLSLDLYALNHHRTFPSWLNLGLGYGAQEMVYGKESDNNYHGFKSYRQFYLGIDIDLSHIKTKSKFVKSLIFVADMIKLPAPALEWNTNKGFNYHWIYF